MEQAFKSFIDQIPSEIIAKTERHATPNMIIFRPKSFIVGEEILIPDYHFCLSTSTPPPIRVGNREYQFKERRIITFTPGIKAKCTVYAPTRQYIAININREFFQKIARETTGKRNIPFFNTNNPYSQKLLRLIQSFEEEMSYKNKSTLMLDSISIQIVIQLLREIGAYDEGEKRVIDDNNYISLAEEYMNAFYNANIKIEDICKQIHLSPYYFIRMFKQKTGLSPHEFLLSIRMKKAEEMLKMGDYSIEEVAKFCGFTNIAHFSNHFKKVKGVSPMEYKKQFLK